MRSALWFILFTLAGCSGPNLAGGTSSSDNARVMGIVTSADGTPVPGAELTVMEGFRTVSHLNADGSGRFVISLKNGDSCFVYAENGGEIGKAGIRSSDDSASVCIDAPASVKLQFPLEASPHLGEMIQFEGVPSQFAVDRIDTVNGHAEITVDRVPFGKIGAVTAAGKEIRGSEITAAAGEVTVVHIDGSEMKPLWRFPLVIGVQKRAADHFGGIDRFADSLRIHLKGVNELLRDDRLNGVLEFTADSFYVFTGTMASEEGKVSAPYAYRYLFSDVNDLASRGVIRFDYLWAISSTFDFFTEAMLRQHASLLAEARGAMDLSEVRIDSGIVPMIHGVYSAPDGLLNNPVKSPILDPYAVSVINFNGAKIGGERDVIHSGHPENMKITVVDSGGNPLPGANVEIFTSALESNSVNSIPAFTGTADQNGTVLFPSPFTIDGILKNGSCLIYAEKSGHTALVWAGAYESGTAWFSGETYFSKTVRLAYSP